MVWQTGTRDGLLVARIMRSIRDYAQSIGERAELLPAIRGEVLALDGNTGHSATLAELIDPGGDGSEWWPR